MKRLVSVFIIFSTSFTFASENSDPFFLTITGRVCDQNGQCSRYNGDSGNFVIVLNDNTGTMEMVYEIEGVTVTNRVHLDVRTDETEVYIEIENGNDPLSNVGSSTLVPSLSELYWSSLFGAPFQSGDLTIYPGLVIGPAAL